MNLTQALDRIAELEQALGLTAKVPRDIFPKEMFPKRSGLSLNRVKPLIGMLAAREFVDRNAAFTCIYSDVADSDQAQPKIMDVFISHARKALQPYGIEIITVYGKGWYIPSEQRAKLRKLLAPANDA